MKILKPLSMAVLGVLLILLIAMQVLNDLAERDRRMILKCRCQKRLESIGQACIAYAHTHAGAFPDALAEIAGTNAPSPLDSPWTFVCGRDRVGELRNVDQWSTYTLVPGLSTASAPSTILAFEPASDHWADIGGNVLYVTGKAAWLSTNDHSRATKGLRQPSPAGDRLKAPPEE